MRYSKLKLKNYTDQSPNFTVISKTLTGPHNLHCHNFFEMEFIVSGSGTQYLNGTPYEIKKGNFYLLTTVDFHELFFTEPTEIINVSFDPSILPPGITKKLTEVFADKNYYLSSPEYEKYHLLLNALLCEYNHSLCWHNDATLNLLQYIVIFFLRQLHVSEPKKGINSDMDAALTYIHIRFKESPTLGEVAAHVHYNPSYFSQLFKTYTGVKYVDYVNALKIDHAKRLLSFTDHSIIDIGFLCGFNSTSNFYLSFKKSTGVSPYQYRSRTSASLRT